MSGHHGSSGRLPQFWRTESSASFTTNDQFRLRLDTTTKVVGLAPGDDSVAYNAADVFIAKAEATNFFSGMIDEIGFYGVP